MTGLELINNTAYTLNQTETKASVIAECLFWANAIQKDMFRRGDWAELIVRDAALVATGAKSYNLKTAITGVTDFGRLRSESVRYGTTPIRPKSIGFIDDSDPDQSQTGDPDVFAVTGKYFVPWPFPGSGSFLLDYVKTPAAIAAATAEASISFDPENHDIIFAGMLYLGMRRYGAKDWVTQYQIYDNQCKDALRHSGKIKYNPRQSAVNPY